MRVDAGSGSRAIQTQGLTVAYRKEPVLQAVDLDLPAGALVGLVGPNGAGKSTLLKALLGLVAPSAGWVSILGRSGAAARRLVGYVPQRESVDWDFPVDVLDVVLMGRYGRIGVLRRPSRQDRERAFQALEQVGMASFARRQISQLSGGQQQRVFLARALAQDAEVYLMDEPLAGVDAATETAIIALLQELRASGKTVLVVHHDLQAVQTFFDWLVLLNGRVVASGPTAQVFTPENLQAAYGGRLAFLPGPVGPEAPVPSEMRG